MQTLAGGAGKGVGVETSPRDAKLVRGEVVMQVTVNDPTAGSNPAEPAKFDREAYHRNYMKEYMRKRRQAEKRDAKE